MTTDVSQYKSIFISESREHLQTLNSSLLELEQDPKDAEALNEMFRATHSLKGMAATMGFDDITKLSHAMENLMDKLKKEGKINQTTIDLLFECVDMLSTLIEDVASDRTTEHDLTPIYKKLKNVPSAKMDDVPKSAPLRGAKGRGSTGGAPTIRIDVEKVGILQDLVGELLIARMRAAQIASKCDIKELNESIAAIDRLTSDLQYTVLAMRMSPVDYLFGKFPRLVRDMSKKEGKDIELVIEGKEIELDRLVMDEINDVLVHLLRNAVDHGIETPEQRAQIGKKPKGTIKLAARREGDYVVIEVSDDGRGIDTEAVKKVAVEKGVITRENASKMSTEEVFDLLGAPGLSTQREVTEFSGRGVGFDVVKSKIRSLGGAIKIQSKKDVGTKVILKLPLTTAIIQSLMVTVGDETYAIPLGSIQEIVDIRKSDLKSIQQREVIKHRGKIVPVLRLKELLDAPNGREMGPVIIVEWDGEMAGLMVDSILGQQKIVVKPLTGILGGKNGFAGATILPDGRVALILDVPYLVKRPSE